MKAKLLLFLKLFVLEKIRQTAQLSELLSADESKITIGFSKYF